MGTTVSRLSGTGMETTPKSQEFSMMASRILLCSRPLHADCHARVLAFEVGEDLGQDVQAGAFVGGDHDFAARHAMHLGQRDQHHAALLERLFGVLLEDLAGSGDRDLAAAAIEQLGAHFFFQRADLRRDGRLSAETPLRSAREAAELGHLEKRFQLIEVHKAAT